MSNIKSKRILQEILLTLFEARLDGFGLLPKDSLVPRLRGSLGSSSGILSTHQFIDAIASKIARGIFLYTVGT